MNVSTVATANIVAISGSLRNRSFNQAALVAARRLQPPGMQIDILDYSDVPVFNEDTEAAGMPEPVRRVREQIAASDGILIATPEYNYSIPGVLKNVIDWMSRKDAAQPETPTPLFRKPLGIIGASVGQFGTARAQLHLRQIAVYTAMVPLNQPEVLISRAQEKFDTSGVLTDDPTSNVLTAFLEAYLGWIRNVGVKWKSNVRQS